MRKLWVAVGALLIMSAVCRGELDVQVKSATAQSHSETSVTSFVTIDGTAIATSTRETKTDPQVVPVAVLDITTDAPRLRVKSRTAEVGKVSENKYLVTKPGEHIVDILALGIVEGELIFEEIEVAVTVPGVPPKPPSPDPAPPKPDDPDDPPDPPPIPQAGLRVLIVVETADLPRMPASASYWTYSVVRNWLNQNCVIGAGGLPEWRVYDQHTEFADTCPEVWCQAMKRKRNSVPWLIVSNGKAGYEGPLPSTANEFLDLVKKFAE